MTTEEIARLANRAYWIVFYSTPIDTGNLRFNALRIKQTFPDVWEIYVDSDKDTGIAPYMVYTNEPWTSPKWGGKQNPNEGWWDKVAKEVYNELKKLLR